MHAGFQTVCVEFERYVSQNDETKQLARGWMPVWCTSERKSPHPQHAFAYSGATRPEQFRSSCPDTSVHNRTGACKWKMLTCECETDYSNEESRQSRPGKNDSNSTKYLKPHTKPKSERRKSGGLRLQIVRHKPGARSGEKQVMQSCKCGNRQELQKA